MPKSKSSKSSRKSKKKSKTGSKKQKVNPEKNDDVKAQTYVTKEIETSIQLLESHENDIVLEALLFLSKYADVELNNLKFVQAHGILPRLLALLDHNICILKVTLRLVSKLFELNSALIQVSQEEFDGAILKICKFYINHQDLIVKNFCATILARYSNLKMKLPVLLQEKDLVMNVLKFIKLFDDNILIQGLELLLNLIEVPEVYQNLSKQEDFNLEMLYEKMLISEESFNLILNIFLKLSYFSDDSLQNSFKDAKLVENIFEIILDPEKVPYNLKCLNIVKHCINNEITKSYFTECFEFLKFSNWVKTCPQNCILICAQIFLELSKINAIKQMLFDLSIEDTILSFLRSDDKKVLNLACEAIRNMSLHKYCCEKMVTLAVIKKILEIMKRENDKDDLYNENALKTLHNFCRRDARTIHMITKSNGIETLMKFLEKSELLSEDSYRMLLEIVNMIVINNQLRSLILSEELYKILLEQVPNDSDLICLRIVEILINCLNDESFRDYFSSNNGPEILSNELFKNNREMSLRFLAVFIHNCFAYDKLAVEFIYGKLLLILKSIEEPQRSKIPLFEKIINLIYNQCLPIKFFETGRLDITDKLGDHFYLINGPWMEPFPFLEVLQLRKISTKYTIYVASFSDLVCMRENFSKCSRLESEIRATPLKDPEKSPSMSSVFEDGNINYGQLSPDPYLNKYKHQVQKLLIGVENPAERIKIIARFVDEHLCGANENCEDFDKFHNFRLHIGCVKQKLGTNMIPIGYLRLGFHCERSLLFKALADKVCIQSSLVKSKNGLYYWNEVALVHCTAENQGADINNNKSYLKMYVVDLINDIGQLLPLGSRECNAYCDIK